MRALPNLAALAKAKPHTLHKLWEGLGYYTRVRNLQRAAQLIMAQHGGQFPHDFEEVLALPGVGRYTAGAICSIAFNQPKPILDGNVIRVLTRCCGIAGNPRERSVNARLWQLAAELVLRAAEIDARTSTSPQASRVMRHDPASLRSAQRVANGTRRARLHAQAATVRRLSDRETLRCVSGRPHRSTARPQPTPPRHTAPFRCLRRTETRPLPRPSKTAPAW